MRFPVDYLRPVCGGVMDNLSFNEISERWSIQTGRAAGSDYFVGALVSAFWRGEFETNNQSAIWIFDGLSKTSDQEGISGKNDGLVTPKFSRTGRQFNKDIQLSRRELEPCYLFRRKVAKTLNGMSEFIPWKWDDTDADLERWAAEPLANWPELMRTGHFEKWRINRDDFALWIISHPFPPVFEMDESWPGNGRRKPQKAGRPSKVHQILEKLASEYLGLSNKEIARRAKASLSTVERAKRQSPSKPSKAF
jgi:hypothetical protein